MNTIKFHGLLSKIFGSSFKIYLNINKFRTIIDAIDCVKSGFRKKLIELHSKGFNYSIEKNSNEINIIPLIGGASKLVRIIVAIIIIIIAIVYFYFTGDALGALEIASFAIPLLTAKDPKRRSIDTKSSTGGGVYVGSRSGKSYVFSNIRNISTQGSIIQFGYGKFLSGSSLINISVKNFRTDETFESENNFSYNEPSDSRFSAEFDPLKK